MWSDDLRTLKRDVAYEIQLYQDAFRGKKVLLNTNDYHDSALWQFFHENFESLGLKALTGMQYHGGLKGEPGPIYVITYLGGDDGDLTVFEELVLDFGGDFLSEGMDSYIEDSDIVVGHPPNSLIEDYITKIEILDKHFVAWGRLSDLMKPGIFELFRDNKLWVGRIAGETRIFGVPQGSLAYNKTLSDEMGDGLKYDEFQEVTVFTNIPHKNRTRKVYLWNEYNPNAFETYSNYDAINLWDKTYIPKGYEGVMGVPLDFATIYNPEIFEILGVLGRGYSSQAGLKSKRVYDEFLEYEPDGTPTGQTGEDRSDLLYLRGIWRGQRYFKNPITGEAVFEVSPRLFIKLKK